MAANVVIRPVGRDERAAWEPLWNGYLAFYEATLAPGASDVTWERFHDSDEPMFLLGAYVDGQLTNEAPAVRQISCLAKVRLAATHRARAQWIGRA